MFEYIRKHKYTFILLLMYVVSVAVRNYLSNYNKIINIYNDEMLYHQLANNIANGRGMSLGHMSNSFDKILYPILIAPAFFLKNDILINKAISLINCTIMCAGIFPTYLLSKEIFGKNRINLCMSLMYLLIADMTFTMTFMSEVLYFPLTTLLMYLYYKVITNNNYKDHLALYIITGFITYLAYLTKAVALFIPAGYAIFVVAELVTILIKNKYQLNINLYKDTLIKASIIFISFFIFYFIFQKLILPITTGSYDVGYAVKKSAWTNSNLTYLPFAISQFIFAILFSVQLFPIIYPAINIKQLSRSTRKYYLFLIATTLIGIIVVTHRISIYEDFNSLHPRIHMRYFSYLFIPLMMIFIKSIYETKERLSKKSKLVLILSSVIVIISSYLLWNGTSNGQLIDHPNLVFCNLLNNQTKITFYIPLVIFIFITALTLLLDKKRITVILFVTAFLVTQVYSNVYNINAWKQENSITINEYNKIEHLKEFICHHTNDNFIYLSNDTNRERCLFDTYLNLDNTSVISLSDILSAQSKNGVDLNKYALHPINAISNNKGIRFSNVRYIITPNKILASNEQSTYIKSASSNLYKVYKLKKTNSIPMISKQLLITSGNNIFDLTSDKSLSYFKSETNTKTTDYYESDSDTKYLIYGLNAAMNKGTYNITLKYSYSGKENEIGSMYLTSTNTNLSQYKVHLDKDKKEAIIKDVKLNQTTYGFDIKVKTKVAHVKAYKVIINKH